MDIIKGFSRNSLFGILFFTALFCVVIDFGFLFTLKTASDKVLILAQTGLKSPEMKTFIHQTTAMMGKLRTYFIPVSTGVLCLLGFFLWFFLHVSFVKLAKVSAPLPQKRTDKAVDKASASAIKEKKLNDQRLFLHLFSVLQREGRLIDFFSEELDDYEDDQIGAAVRNIHENCKKAISKYLIYDAVVTEEEEEEITVPSDFDPGTIKLTGNVTGEPPFKGVVRHRGWKIKKLDMPTLSGSQNPDIIAPAEVEIV